MSLPSDWHYNLCYRCDVNLGVILSATCACGYGFCVKCWPSLFTSSQPVRGMYRLGQPDGSFIPLCPNCQEKYQSEVVKTGSPADYELKFCVCADCNQLYNKD